MDCIEVQQEEGEAQLGFTMDSIEGQQGGEAKLGFTIDSIKIKKQVPIDMTQMSCHIFFTFVWGTFLLTIDHWQGDTMMQKGSNLL